jgi:hypothetical protein
MPYRGTSAAVVALTPREKIMLRAGRAFRYQSYVIRGATFGIVLPVKL